MTARLALLAALLLVAYYVSSADECHTDTECALMYPGTNGDPE